MAFYYLSGSVTTNTFRTYTSILRTYFFSFYQTLPFIQQTIASFLTFAKIFLLLHYKH